MLLLVGCVDVALAAPSANALPWESPLAKFTKSLTGPIAKYVSIAAIVSAGAGLAFGGDMKEFTRKMLMVVIVVAGLVFSTKILTVLFNVTAP